MCSNKEGNFSTELVKGGPRRRQAKELKIYVEYLLISQLNFTVSFLPIDWNSVHASLLTSATFLGKASLLLHPRGKKK